MATASDPDADPPDGVKFVHEDDGRVTARHIESAVASFGETEAEALRELADALDSHFGQGDAIDDPHRYLQELGVDVEIGEGGPRRGLSRVGRTTFSSTEVITNTGLSLSAGRAVTRRFDSNTPTPVRFRR